MTFATDDYFFIIGPKYQLIFLVQAKLKSQIPYLMTRNLNPVLET